MGEVRFQGPSTIGHADQAGRIRSHAPRAWLQRLPDAILTGYWVPVPTRPPRDAAPGPWSARGWPPASTRLPGNRLPYRWEFAVHGEREDQLLIKTMVARFAGLERRPLKLHPNEVPKLIAVPVAHGHRAYLGWVCQQSRGWTA